MINRWIIIILFFTVVGCVEPLTIDFIGRSDGQLVVEGWVNNVDEVVVVRLATSTNDGVGENVLGKGATVTITDGAGIVYLLDEPIPGTYATLSEPLLGTVGESYQLDILLENGRSYTSESVTLPAPVQFGPTRDIPVENRGLTDQGVPFVNYSNNIFTTLENTAEEHFVQLNTRGWANVLVDYQLEAAGPLSCWQIRTPATREIILANNAGVIGEMYEIEVNNISVDVRANYVMELFANSMSREAFVFWSEAQRQLERGGGVFDPPFAPVVGNIRNTQNPNEIVLGYFHAYAQTMTRYCFSRLGVPGEFEVPIIGPTVLCTEFYAPAVFELPFDDEIQCPE